MQRKFLDYNTLQYTLADPRYAVSHHSDGYSGTAIAVATLVTAYRGTAIAVTMAVPLSVTGSLQSFRDSLIAPNAGEAHAP